MAKPLHDNYLGFDFGFMISAASSGKCIVSPRDFRAFIVFTTILFAAILVIGVWFLPKAESTHRQAGIATCIIGGIAAVSIVASMIWFNRKQQQFGPFIVLAEDVISLRDDQHIEFEMLETFEVSRSWTPGDEYQTTYLTLQSKDGRKIEVLSSTNHGEVLKVKQTLEKWVEEKRHLA